MENEIRNDDYDHIEVMKINKAIDYFQSKMLAKMLAKFYDGYRDWDNPECKDIIKKKLLDNLERNDWIDVANCAMMLHLFAKMESIENLENEQ